MLKLRFFLSILIAAVLQFLYLPYYSLFSKKKETNHDNVLAMIRKITVLNKRDSDAKLNSAGYHALQYWATESLINWFAMVDHIDRYGDELCLDTVIVGNDSIKDTRHIDISCVLMALGERLASKKSLMIAGNYAEKAILGGISSKERDGFPYRPVKPFFCRLLPGASILEIAAWFEIARASKQRNLDLLGKVFFVLMYPTVYMLRKPSIRLSEACCCRALFALTVAYRLSCKSVYYKVMEELLKKEWYAKPIVVMLWKLYFASDATGNEEDKLSLLFRV